MNLLLCEKKAIPEDIEHVSSGAIVKMLSLLVLLDRDFRRYILEWLRC